MKKLLFVYFTLFLFHSSFAQENEIFLMRFHEMEVTGNQGEFIAANKNYFKPLAEQAIKDNIWAGWQMLRSVTEPNKYIFIHYFSSPKQYASVTNPFSPEVAKKLGLKSPNSDSYKWKTTAPQEIFQVVMALGGNSKSNYWMKNDFKFNNSQKFIDNNKLWGELVVKKMQKDIKGMNWGFGVNLSSAHFENGEAISYNGVSFDGAASLDELLTNRAYKENPEANQTLNKVWQNFQKEVQEKDLTNFSTANRSTMWQLVDSTW
tara:strand:- start:499 stop:1284 length:786 start_codon:yes stop_codon:yes gene_type:complete